MMSELQPTVRAISEFGILIVIAGIFLIGYWYDLSEKRKIAKHEREVREKERLEDRRRDLLIEDEKREQDRKVHEERMRQNREALNQQILLQKEMTEAIKQNAINKSNYDAHLTGFEKTVKNTFEDLELDVQIIDLKINDIKEKTDSLATKQALDDFKEELTDIIIERSNDGKH